MPKVILGNVGKPKLTAIEAGVFQLESAIHMWFLGGNAASITTLTFSGHEVLYQLAQSLPKKVQTIADNPKNNPLPEGGDWKTLFKLDYNFCKHAGKGKKRDPLETHYFSVDVLPFVLFDATNIYLALGFGRRLYFYVLRAWIMTTLPHIFENTLEEKGFDPEYVKDCIRMGRTEYFKAARAQFANTTAGDKPWSPVVQGAATKPGA